MSWSLSAFMHAKTAVAQDPPGRRQMANSCYIFILL